MSGGKMLEQHIAVFGESGSGKTVLLSSFYGPTQQKVFAERSRFRVVADNHTLGTKLYQNYLGMRDSRKLPEPTQFRSTAYSFTLKMAPQEVGADTTVAHDTMRIVWHDYPGEWFEQDVTGEEVERRVEGFRSLLRSDVAILLVDAQRLIDNEGQEHAYLKSLFYNYRQGFEAVRGAVLEDGKPLVRFPRIWMLALSKSDLLPELDVHKFKELVIRTAGDDLALLGGVIASMVETPEALSVGDDFLLLSSAKFTPEKIVVTERVGLDLILPIASVMPFERHLKWANVGKLPAQVAKDLLRNADALAGAVAGTLGFLATKAPAPIRPVFAALASLLSKDTLGTFIQLGHDKLQEFELTAAAKREYLAAVLARFRLDLAKGEEDDVLLRSLR